MNTIGGVDLINAKSSFSAASLINAIGIYAEGIYHPPEADIILKIYHPFPKETDIIEKSTSEEVLFSGASDGT